MGKSFVSRARDLGREHGENAAAWWLQETPVGGRSSASGPEGEAWARETLARLDAGDDCGMPEADLSGEWSGNMTPAMLADEIGYDAETDKREEWGFLHSDLCDAYLSGFAEACERAVVNSLRSSVKSAQASR